MGLNKKTSLIKLCNINQIFTIVAIIVVILSLDSLLPKIARYFLSLLSLFIFIFKIRDIPSNRIYTIIVGFVIMCFSVIYWIKLPEYPKEQINSIKKLYDLSVNIYPNSNNITYINDSLVGYNSYTYKLSKGTYMIKVYNEEFNKTIYMQIQIPKDNFTTINFKK